MCGRSRDCSGVPPLEGRSLTVPVMEPLSDKLGFLVLKPDCVLRGLVRSMEHELAQEGFEVVAFRIGRMPTSLLFQMHGTTARLEVDDWHFNVRMHEFGPSIGLLLRSNRTFSGGFTAQTRLGAIKGGALPSNFGADTLRSRMRALNRVCNLLHCPDTSEEAASNLTAWMPRAVLEPTQLRGIADYVANEVEQHGYLDVCLDPAALAPRLRERLQHAAAWNCIDSELIRLAEAVLADTASGKPLEVGAHGFLIGLMEFAGVFVSSRESYVLEIAQRYPASRRPLRFG